jgi:hypothetical protein
VGIALTFSACEAFFPSNKKYTFDNQSNYTIYVTLNTVKNYQTKSGEEYYDSNTNEITLYSGYSEPKEIYIESDPVDFSWTAYNETDNQYIKCEVDQGKATFTNYKKGEQR